MAEKKTTEQQTPPEGKPDEQQTPPEEKPTASSTTARTRSAAGGGEYVVIGDQITVRGADGKSYTTHRYGAKVSLTDEQAARFTGGTRPVVVDAAKVKGGDVGTAARVAVGEAARERMKRRGRPAS